MSNRRSASPRVEPDGPRPHAARGKAPATFDPAIGSRRHHQRPPAPWAIVLAGGRGARLSSLTVGPDGRAVPKQYCSIDGKLSMLQAALDRARATAPMDRIVTVVAEEHRHWWHPEIGDSLPAANVILQPENRGTAGGILLPIFTVLGRDPDAIVTVFPSDHYVADEALIEATVAAAVRVVRRHGDRIVLLGISPETIETGYGWIVPLERDEPFCEVSCFFEKPDSALAALLARRGALWNSFIWVARADAVLRECERLLPEMTARLRDWFASPEPRDPGALAEMYEAMPSVDFSHDVLERAENLWVYRVPHCGWSDLGSPERMLACLRRYGDGASTLHLPAQSSERSA